MKNTKLIIAGLTAAITLSGASAVFAEDTTDGSVQVFEKTGTGSGRFQEMEIDMSALELPEGFVPFDEVHVPDGIHAPENGELKPIEFDEDGNMIYRQRPPMFDEMEGQRPEFAEGDRPGFTEGARPAFPGGGTQEMNGVRPELPDVEMPVFEEGDRPELPAGEMPAFTEGEMQEMQQGKMAFGDSRGQMMGKNI